MPKASSSRAVLSVNQALTHSIRATARYYHVSPNTVFLLRQRCFETGTLQPKTPVHRPSRLITPAAELQIQAWLAETPDLTLHRRSAIYTPRPTAAASVLRRCITPCSAGASPGNARPFATR
jgi:transposase